MTEMPPGASQEERPVLLDTSAILTFIEDEEGADRVGEALSNPTTLVPWPVLLETHHITQREEGQAEADRRLALLKQVDLTILWEVDEPMLLTASQIKAKHRLSLADCIIAAYAIRAGAILMHKDPEYEALRDRVAMEALPYKRRA